MVKQIKVEIIRLEHEIACVRDRIRDIEWRIENGENVIRDARTKAIDKLRHLNNELLKLKVEQCQTSSVSQG